MVGEVGILTRADVGAAKSSGPSKTTLSSISFAVIKLLTAESAAPG